MAETTKIEWCDATFNPWTGCTKWGPDCDGCYAAAFSLRVGGPEYKKGVPRRRCAGFEKSALALARKAAKLGKRLKVFPSLCDVFDAEAPPEWRADFWRVVDATRDRLDWLILTKRTENVAGMLPDGPGGSAQGSGVMSQRATAATRVNPADLVAVHAWRLYGRKARWCVFVLVKDDVTGWRAGTADGTFCRRALRGWKRRTRRNAMVRL